MPNSNSTEQNTNHLFDLETTLNACGKTRTPCLFVISYNMSEYYVSPLDRVDSDILYAMGDQPIGHHAPIAYTFEPPPYAIYKEAFDRVIEQIKRGNTYLLNLTFASRLVTDVDLKTLYAIADARFKLYYKGRFACFSPERFVDIRDNTIYTYPMKGTIDASMPNAQHRVLSDIKEMAEHVMVVDLLRNDLNRISRRVTVEDFRYVETIKAGERELLQVSSRIRGTLERDWHDRLGTILTTLLPAGSITGTPKIKTVEIIEEIENYDRGFFSGIFGIYDGAGLDSAVMIRFVEKQEDGLYYKSGGGITIDSKAQREYEELKEKVYVPVF